MTKASGSWLGVLLLAVVGCDSLPGKPSEADRFVHPADVLDFATLYAQNCSGCHGAEGRLGPARALHDPLYLALAPPRALRATIRAGVAGTPMPAFAQSEGGTLSDAQIDALVEGLRKSWGGPLAGALPPYSEAAAISAGLAPGDPARGREAFAVFCADCHGTEGRGSDEAGSVVDPAYLALVSDQGLRTSVIVGRKDLDTPDWRGYVRGRVMSDQEISDVVAWLVSERPTHPGQPHPEQPGGSRR
jgi:mono/diheme cytochrome c family protein